MKNFISIFATKVVVLIGITSAVLGSCHGDPVFSDLEVTTLSSDIPGVGFDAVTHDTAGNIYMSEFGEFAGGNGNGTRIFKIDKFGAQSVFIENLEGPLGNAIDNHGNFYVVHSNDGGGSGEVLKIAADGTRTVLATVEGFPAGLTIDKKGNLYVSNFVTPTVHKITPSGEFSLYAEDESLAGGVGIDIDKKGNVIVGNYVTADILSIDKKGEVSLIANIPDIVVGGGGIGYIIVAGNSIFATGISTHKIFRVSMSGEVIHFAGSGESGEVDGPLLEATFRRPNGITAYNRTLFIGGYGATSLRKIQF
ncbi:hypothetical protein [Aquimarina pacifica]|uniref:hypothetical protein n=1 Tax=Aquimarina pacifica TaxID=1296415 RepID=UPI00046F0921|nr:hypothetical protein [Aquimarina pacifica]